MADLPKQSEPDEEGGVGYGRPPLHSRFKPGQSGNPRGRPRRKLALEEIANEILQEKTWVTLRGTRKRVAAERAVFYRILEQALKGDIRAARLLFGMRAASSKQDGGSSASFLSDEDLAILASAGIVPGKGDPDVGA